MSEANQARLYRELLRVYFDNADDGVFLLCDALRFVAVNQRLEEWLRVGEGFLTRERKEATVTDFLEASDQHSTLVRRLSEALDGDSPRFECRLVRAGSDSPFLEVTLHLVSLEEGDFLLGIARDITERQALMHSLTHQANHDELTGLPNRRCFMERLQQVLDDATLNDRQHMLAYVDLDHFKVINDTSGHAAGDQCLLHLVDTVRAELGESDFVARIGGDEFGLLLMDVDADECKARMERLCSALADTAFRHEDRLFRVTASIGFTAIHSGRDGVGELLSFADAACYVAKDEGRNGVMEYYGGTRCAGKRQEMEWVAAVNSALENDRFQLFFQEIHPLKDGGVPHCELLLRMCSEDGVLVSPARFIPAAERYGLMPAVDRWVVDALLDFLQTPEGAGRDVIWAVNLSGGSFTNTGFVAYLLDRLADPGIRAERLCFEITETQAITNVQLAQKFMSQLRELGCRIALDDFGSGMSTFAYLKNLPIDYVKIDGSLVSNIVDCPTDRSIVGSVNEISHTLGFRTIAEFVENEQISAVLEALGVDFVQGFGIHVPEPLFEVPGQERVAGQAGLEVSSS